jgi:ABC-type Fe3+/spermidine/putrescine transport system ATPase subunit
MQMPNLRAEVAGDAILALDDVTKSFRNQTILDRLSLRVGAGEFLTLLGPSGCGKSTTLNLIAGFLTPDAGTIRLRDRLVNTTPPRQRRLGMVFQSWALFPHMTVFDNVAYGLRARGVAKAALRVRVARMLDVVHLAAAADKFPSQLSGGMQQRAALARALVTEPDVLLLDEPLSNLDAGLREHMQMELKRIHEELQVTTVLVTHSQEEALVMSDRIAVLRDGRIAQIGPPRELYDQPGTRFVCRFLGDANLLDCTVDRAEAGEALLRLETVPGAPRIVVTSARLLHVGQRVAVAVRPENVRLGTSSDAAAIAPATITDLAFKGHQIEYQLRAGDQDFQAFGVPSAATPVFARGQSVILGFDRASIVLLDEEPEPRDG